MITRSTMMGCDRPALLGGSTWAQQWPARPVKIIVTFPPGGASDAAARVISALSEKLGQSVVVDNKPGGGTTIGAKGCWRPRTMAHA